MTKIQIIIDDGESLKGITCNNISVESFEPENPWEQPRFGSYQFVARDIVFDESSNLISIPDELLLRIRDYNIDVEHEYTLEQTRKLKQKNDDLQRSIGNNLIELNALEKEVERFHDVLEGMIDRYPMAAAEICLQDGNLEAACYFAQKANEEENRNVSPSNIIQRGIT